MRRASTRAIATSLALLVTAAPLGGSSSASARDGLVPRTEGPKVVSPAVERSIDRGIRYLLGVRDGSGVWRNRSRPRRGRYPCANTALVGLVLLANGSTPTRGPHAKVLSEITEYLVSSSQSNGLITDSDTREERTMYSHAFGMTFLSTVYGQEGRPDRRRRIERTLERGVRLLERSQTPEGGWGYVPNHYEDEGTLVVTELTGLRACRDVGLHVQRGMIDRGVQYIRDSTRSDGRVMYRVRSNRFRAGVTCAAVVALWHAGQYDSLEMRAIRSFVENNIAPDTGHIWSNENHGEYIEYYLAQAIWLRGGPRWERHYRDISRYLTAVQNSDGSFYGDDTSDYGVIYSTAIALLILQIPYQRLPAFQR